LDRKLDGLLIPSESDEEQEELYYWRKQNRVCDN